ncbi:hypothetical protein K439DRAFT_532038 [Ramaria rubella]|nr:hypothetical protein K439DRAFT_532038 [Ramaria rubella]
MLPIPNEILHQILLDHIIDNIHNICKPADFALPNWRAFIAILHVSHIFRETSLRVMSMSLLIELDVKGNLPVKRILQDLKLLWSLSPINIPFLPRLRLERLLGQLLSDLQVDNTGGGLLYIYRAAAGSTVIWHQVSTLGWEHRTSKQESFRIIKLMLNLTIKAGRRCEELRPRALTAHVSELIITHCVTPYLTCSYWHVANTLDHYLAVDEPFAHPSSVQPLSAILKIQSDPEAQIIKLIPARLIKHYTPHGRLLTRAILEDSGLLRTMRTILLLDASNQHGFRAIAEKALEDWASFLYEESSDPPFHSRPVYGGGRKSRFWRPMVAFSMALFFPLICLTRSKQIM